MLASLAARAVFVSRFLLFLHKTSVFELKPPNNYPDLHHSHGTMKFATQILHLVNLVK